MNEVTCIVSVPVRNNFLEMAENKKRMNSQEQYRFFMVGQTLVRVVFHFF